MLRSFFFATVLVGAVQGAAAQPALVLSTDVVAYPAETEFTATNAGTDSLALSFLSTELGFGTVTGYGWGFEVEAPDSLYEDVYLPFTQPFGDPPSISLAAEESVVFRIAWFDSCPVCAVNGGGFSSDTLFLRAADPSGADTANVVLDLSGYVAVELTPPDTAPFRVEAYPNPARRTLHLAVTYERGEDVEVVIVDALGRVVRRISSVSAVGDAYPLDLDALPSGSYLVRVRAPGGKTVTRPFVLLR